MKYSTLSTSSFVRQRRLLRGGVDLNFLPKTELTIISVASFAEAWIEITVSDATAIAVMSPPSRRRGLKFFFLFDCLCFCGSPPSRRRGLKFFCFSLFSSFFLVASFAEAWIEIVKTTALNADSGRLLRGGVD